MKHTFTWKWGKQTYVLRPKMVKGLFISMKRIGIFKLVYENESSVWEYPRG